MRMTLDQITTAIEKAEAARHIWNVDFVEIKESLDRMVETRRSDRSVLLDHYLEQLGRDYHISTWASGTHDLANRMKQLDKVKGDGEFHAKLDRIRGLAAPLLALHNRLKALKPFIEKGRKPSENPSLVPPRTLENTGTCGCCSRNVKLTGSGQIWTHGYTVDFHYGRSRDCFGTGYEPIEVSPKVLQDLVVLMEKRLPQLPKVIENLEDRIANLPKETPHKEKSDLRMALFQAKQELAHLETKIPEFHKAIATWTPRPLPR